MMGYFSRKVMGSGSRLVVSMLSRGHLTNIETLIIMTKHEFYQKTKIMGFITS